MNFIPYQDDALRTLINAAGLVQQTKMNRQRRGEGMMDEGFKSGDEDLWKKGYQMLYGKDWQAPQQALSPEQRDDEHLAGMNANDVSNRINKEVFSRMLGTTSNRTPQFGTAKEYDDYMKSGGALLGNDVLSRYRELTPEWQKEIGNESVQNMGKSAYADNGILVGGKSYNSPGDYSMKKMLGMTPPIEQASQNILNYRENKMRQGMEKFRPEETARVERSIKAAEDKESDRLMTRDYGDVSPLAYRQYGEQVRRINAWEQKAIDRARSDRQRAEIAERAKKMRETAEQKYGYLFRTYEGDRGNPWIDMMRAERRGGGAGSDKFVTFNYPGGRSRSYRVSQVTDAMLNDLHKKGGHLTYPKTGTGVDVLGGEIRNVTESELLDEDAQRKLGIGKVNYMSPDDLMVRAQYFFKQYDYVKDPKERQAKAKEAFRGWMKKNNIQSTED